MFDVKRIVNPLEIVVGDEGGRDGAAEAQDGRGHDDGHGGAHFGHDGAHGQGQDELGQENHGRDDAHVGADATNLVFLGAAARNVLVVLIVVIEIFIYCFIFSRYVNIFI